MQQARSGTCDKRELGATTRNNASKIHDESQLCSGSKLWSRPPQGNVEKDERKQYRDHSSGTNEFDEPWIKDKAARDVLFCTRMRTIYIIYGFALCRQPLWIDCRISGWMFGWPGGLHGKLPTRPLSSWIAGSGNGSESAFEVASGVDEWSI